MSNYEPKIRDNYVAFQDDSSIVIDVFAEVRQRDGDVLTVSAVSNPVNGIVAIEADRTVAYALDRQYHGVGTFTHTIDDEHGLTSTAAVSAPVTPVNDRPVVECGPETGADATGGRVSLIARFLTPLQHGAVQITRNASADGATVVNDAPTTNVAAAAGTEDAGFIAITLTGSDIDGTVRSFSLSSLPANGSLYIDAGLTTLVATGIDYPAAAESLTLYFVPNAEFNCSASFDCAAKDDAGDTDTTPATATITVAPVNDDSVANADATNEDSALAITADAGVLANDTDVDLDTLNVVDSDAISTNGDTLTMNPDGSVTYTPAADFSYAGSVAYTVSGGIGSSAPTGASVTVNLFKDVPVKVGDSPLTSIVDGLVITIPISSLLAHSRDIENDIPARVSLVAGSAIGREVFYA